MKENINFNQHPVSSYASQIDYLWCRIFLLLWQQHSPNINFWIGLEESFQKMSTFTPLLPFVSEIEFFNENLLRNDWFCDFSLYPPLPLKVWRSFILDNFLTYGTLVYRQQTSTQAMHIIIVVYREEDRQSCWSFWSAIVWAEHPIVMSSEPIV